MATRPDDDPWMDKARPEQSEDAEFRRLCKRAVSPKTPAAELEAAADTVTKSDYGKFSDCQSVRVLEAVAANPNAPPYLLAQMLGWSHFTYLNYAPYIARAFCRNPVTPFLLLEQPDFVARLDEKTQRALLREADVPSPFAQQLAKGNAAQSDAVREEAAFHIALAKNADAPSDWEADLKKYWRQECALAKNEKDGQWHSDFAELGLAPSWALGASPAPIAARKTIRRAALDVWFEYHFAPGSSKEAALLKRIGPNMKNKTALAHGLGKEAAEKDLLGLLFTLDNHAGMVWQALLRHPSADAKLLEAMTGCDDETRYAIAQHGRAGHAALTILAESHDPQLRRLARRHPNAPANACDLSRRAIRRYAHTHTWHAPTPFVAFVESLHCGIDQKELPQIGDRLIWTDRLNAAFCAAVTDKCIIGDRFDRTGRDLLRHLARDGNRLVRSVAQTRLQNPEYVFTWDDGA